MRRVSLIFTVAALFLVSGAEARDLYIGGQVGANSTEKVEGYGGSQITYGMHFLGSLSQQLYWRAFFETNHLGKGDIQVKKDRVVWMGGVGMAVSRWNFELGLGIVDTMTTYYFDPDETVVDPFTGVTLASNTDGIKHDVIPGYRLAISYNFWEFNSGRMRLEAAYSDVFQSYPYKGIVNLLLIYDFRIPEG